MPPLIEIDQTLFHQNTLKRRRFISVLAIGTALLVLIVATIATPFMVYHDSVEQKLHDALFPRQTTLSYARINQTASAAGPLTSNSPIATPTSSPAATSTIVSSDRRQTTIIQQPVVERVIEKAVPQPLTGFVSPTNLSSALSNLRNELLTRINNITNPAQTVPQSVAAGGNAAVLSYASPAAQRIDSLSNVTVSGVSGLTASDIPTLPYLSLSGGTVSGTTSLNTLSAGASALATTTVNGDLSVSGNITGTFTTATSSAVSFSAINFVTTNATTTNLVGTNAFTANATSTTLFASLGHFTTGVIDTLTSTAANITNLIATTITGTNATFTNATTTNATSTNLYAAAAVIPSLTGASATFTSATTTNLFSTTASSTNLFATNGTFGALSAGTLTLTNALTVSSGGTGWNNLANGVILFGNGSSAIATSSNLFWDNTNNRLGIGTMSPGSTFSLQGSAGQAASLFNLASSTGTSIFNIDKNGNVTVATNCIGCDDSNFSNELSHFRLAVAKTRNGLQDTKILFIGDSTTKGIGSTLSSTFPTYGSYLQYIKLGSDTAVGQGLATSNLNNPDSRFVKGAGWTNYSGTFGFAGSAFTATAASGNLVFTPGSTQGTFDTFDVYYVRFSTGGNLSITATGSSTSLTVNTAGASAIMKATVTAGSAGINNSVSIVDTSGTVYVLGIEPYLSTKPSVRLGNAGMGGSTSGGWANANGGFGAEATIQAYTPDLCVISLGINDATGSVAPATLSSNLQTVITACQASGDVVLMTMPPSTGSPYSTLEPQYVQAEYQLAQSDGLPVVDIYKRFGNTYNSNYMSDPYHPNQYGYQDWGAAISQFLNSIVGSNYSNPLPNFSVVGQGKSDPFDVASSSGISELHITLGGNVGVGTSTPYARLTIWGPDSAASTTAFLVANNASTTEFTVLDNGNATLAGNLIQNSDLRLKTNIQLLNASTSLAAIDALNPITYNWVDPDKGGNLQLGFIAQDVQKIFPNLVATTSPTALTPDGTLSLNYNGLIAPIVRAIQTLSTQVQAFAQSITTTVLNATEGHFSNELCVGNTCVTPTQFQAMVAATGQTSSAPPSTPTTASATPPVIQITGGNPLSISVGTNNWIDPGAAIIGPANDVNLGIKTFLNGLLVSNIVLDTSQVATDTIDYVVTDQFGLTATSTRTVVIQAVQSTKSF